MNCFRIFRLSTMARVVALFVLLPVTVTHAATTTFTGQSSTDWNTAANWNSAVPGTGDLARVFGADAVAEVSTGSATSSYVDVRQDGTLNVTGGNLTFGYANNRWLWAGWQTPGTVNQSGGVVGTSGANVDVIVDNFGTYNLTGGALDISDDLRLEGNAVFNISGDSTVDIGDDLRVANGSNVEFNVQLIGDDAPAINVSDDLVLRNTTTLNIDSTNWTGGSAITLFDVGDRVVGEFASVTLDGVAVPASQYQFSSGSVIISVPESSSMPVAAWFVVVLPFARLANRKRAC